MRQYLATGLLSVLFLGGVIRCWPFFREAAWQRELRAELARPIGRLRSQQWVLGPRVFSTGAGPLTYVVRGRLARTLEIPGTDELAQFLIDLDASIGDRRITYLFPTYLEINRLLQGKPPLAEAMDKEDISLRRASWAGSKRSES